MGSLLEQATSSVKDYAKRRWDFLTRNTAPVCDPILDAKKASDNLSKCIFITRWAAQAKLKDNSAVVTELKKASEAMDKINKGLGKANKICTKIKAFQELAEASNVLHEWHAGKKNDADAARAFELLFGAVATFARELPTPINEYSRILDQIKEDGFFSKMQALGASRAGLSDATPTGRILNSVMKDIDDPYRPNPGN